ncbi:MAG: RsmD family RNA methyltransferase [Prevotella sp.]
MKSKIREFIRQHADEDVKTLALKAHGMEGIDLHFALDQIAGRQIARQKLPTWAATDGIVYPPHISMEQCSSEATAQYKQNIALTSNSLVDLTGGFGVDFSFLARNFSKAIYVERQEHLCGIARENFRLLGLAQAEVVCSEAESFLKTMPHADLIYLDPARRDTAGARTFAISDCTPDVIALRDQLLQKADRIMLKLSPMLDWRKAVNDLGERNVSEVHVVSVNNECKELLIVMKAEETEGMKVVGVNLEMKFSSEGKGWKIECRDYCTAQGAGETPTLPTASNQGFNTSLPSMTLYEPNSSIMKIGCFDEIAERFGVCQVARNSHLFLSDHEVEDFPGRSFSIVARTTMNKRELKAAFADVKSANIAVRNFPLSAVELRKRLKLKDGGDTYIFATTDADNQHILFICKKTAKKK